MHLHRPHVDCLSPEMLVSKGPPESPEAQTSSRVKLVDQPRGAPAESERL